MGLMAMMAGWPKLLLALIVLLSTQRAYSFCNIPRIDGSSLTYHEWQTTQSKEPVILTNLTQGWAALSIWSKKNFSEKYGSLLLPRSSSTGVHFTLDVKRFKSRIQHLAKFAYPTLTTHIMNAIREDYQLPSILQTASLETILSFGGAPQGANFQRHQVAWLATVYGSKHWYMAAPTTKKPPEPQCFSHRGDGSGRGEEGWKEVGVRYCEVFPGEILWVPPQWWHATCNGDPYTVALGGQQYIPYRDRLVQSDGTLPLLHLAALRGNISSVRRLLESEDAPPLCPRGSKRSGSAGGGQAPSAPIRLEAPHPIHLAVKNDHIDVIRWLLKKAEKEGKELVGDREEEEEEEVEEDNDDDEGSSSLSNISLMNCLIRAREPSGKSLAEWAAEYGHVDLLDLFVKVAAIGEDDDDDHDHDDDDHDDDNDGEATALVFKDSSPSTPRPQELGIGHGNGLQLATMKGHLNAVKWLVENGAKGGARAYAMATEYGRSYVYVARCNL
eukprot:jgi/Bigna1/138847/aug1.47_g13555